MSKGPGYGWRWKRGGELYHPNDMIELGDLRCCQVKDKFPDLIGKPIARTSWVSCRVEVGEGYRLLGWEEEALRGEVEVTEDGSTWMVPFIMGTERDSEIFCPKEHTACLHAYWLAARVPVEKGDPMNLWGTWPGNESTEELLDELRSEYPSLDDWACEIGVEYSDAQALRNALNAIRDEALEEAAAHFEKKAEDVRPASQYDSRIFWVGAQELRKLKKGGDAHEAAERESKGQHEAPQGVAAGQTTPGEQKLPELPEGWMWLPKESLTKDGDLRFDDWENGRSCWTGYGVGIGNKVGKDDWIARYVGQAPEHLKLPEELDARIAALDRFCERHPGADGNHVVAFAGGWDAASKYFHKKGGQ